MENTFFKTLKVKVPNRSAHPLSHFSCGTGKCGQLIPFLCKEVIAGTKINLSQVLQASCAPWAVDSFAKLSVNLEVFFVPIRLCGKGNAKWYTAEPNSNGDYTQREILTITNPNDAWTDTAAKQYFGAGSLLDYLGYKFSDADIAAMRNNTNFPVICPDKLVAYHLIWDTYYRNTKIQRSCFRDDLQSAVTDYLNYPFRYINTFSRYNSTPFTVHTLAAASPSSIILKLADNHNVLDLRQRNWDLDYFTSSMVSAQQGNPQSVSFDTSGATGNFTIASLRAANSLQLWSERNGITGYDYCDWLYSHYGTAPKDTLANKPLYLGRSILDVKTRGIYQTSNNDTTIASSSNYSNPYAGTVGASVGRGYGDGASTLLKHFEVDEPGYLFVIGSLVPRVTYSNGIVRENLHYIANGSVTDMANPLLQNVGNQPIYAEELSPSNFGMTSVVGYTDRYAEYMSMVDELHGLLRDGKSLQAFALQRSFGTTAPTLGTSFIQIPTNYLDQVKVKTTGGTNVASDYDFWYDIYFDFKVSHPLHMYSIPSLQDPAYEHGKTVTITRTGQKLG